MTGARVQISEHSPVDLVLTGPNIERTLQVTVDDLHGVTGFVFRGWEWIPVLLASHTGDTNGRRDGGLVQLNTNK